MGIKRSSPVTSTVVGAADLFTIPKNMIGQVTRIDVRNPTASDARIRITDTYTPEGMAATTVNKMELTVKAGTQINIDIWEAIKLIGAVKVDSDVAGLSVVLGVELT